MEGVTDVCFLASRLIIKQSGMRLPGFVSDVRNMLKAFGSSMGGSVKGDSPLIIAS